MPYLPLCGDEQYNYTAQFTFVFGLQKVVASNIRSVDKRKPCSWLYKTAGKDWIVRNMRQRSMS